MASTWFLDLVGGNDGNSGASYAQRMKTFSALAAKAIAAGDLIKVAKSGDPVSIGTATWTDGSPNVTIGASVIKNVDMCETAWTAGANITTSTTTASGSLREGTKACTFAVGAGYVNGVLAAFKAITSTDFSAYQQLNFYFMSTATIAAGDWTIALCSDTIGVVPVYTFNVPANTTGTFQNACVVDNGSLMTLATAIQSIALTKINGAGTPTVTIDDIFVSTGPGTSNCITLQSLIGKNVAASDGSTGTIEWFPIQSINGTTVGISGSCFHVPGSLLTMAVTSEAVTTYARPFIPLTGQTWSKSGSAAGGQVSIVGGYNTSDSMVTLDGQTFFGTPSYNAGVYIFDTSSLNYLTVQNIGTTGSQNGWNIASMYHSTFNTCWSMNAHNLGMIGGGAGGNNTFLNVCSFHPMPQYCHYQFAPGNLYRDCRFKGGNLYNLLIAGNDVIFDRCSFSAGTSTAGSGNGPLAYLTQGGWATIRNSYFQRNAADIATGGDTVYLDNCTLASSTETLINPAVGQFTRIMSTNHDATVNNHQQWHDGGKIISDSTTRHTASGIAWKFSPTNAARVAVYPLRTIIAKVAVSSGTLVTVAVFCAKDSSNISGGLFIRGGQIGGPTADTTVLSSCATTSTYETVATTTNWTPTAAGVVEIEGIAYGGTTNNFWMDDISITQV